MSNSDSPEPALLKAVLDPLLEDFQHWFGRAIHLLESEDIPFLSAAEQQNLLQKVRQAQHQVTATQALSAATGNQAGVDMPLVMSWHRLVHECWQVAIRFRQETQAESSAQ
ncbi:MAG: DUF2605 domain-containing protein [Leptolyngbya sp. SIO4C1]|nr:DUF2605 domain-containing protein [Leptolyngbya sp. SIO4C1]